MPELKLQRACACRGNGLKCSAEHESQETAVSPIVEEATRSSGLPLERPARAFMEAGFGEDLSRVRVHTDARAAEAARHVGAKAFTVGPHIVFGVGQYAPEATAGRRLLAHELAHVTQQRFATPAREPLAIGSPDAPAEREADRVADAVVKRRSVAVGRAAVSGGQFSREKRFGRRGVTVGAPRVMTQLIQRQEHEGTAAAPLVFDFDRPPMPLYWELMAEVRSASGLSLVLVLGNAWNHLERSRSLAQQQVSEAHALAERLESFFNCPDASASTQRYVRGLVDELEALRDMLEIEGDEELEAAITASFEFVANRILLLETTFRDIDAGHIRGCLSARLAPFADGLLAGLQEFGDDELRTLVQRYLASALFNVVFPGVMAAGAALGIAEDGLELLQEVWGAVTAPVEAARNAIESLEAIGVLFEELAGLEGGALAEELGREAGQALVQEARNLNATDNVVEFSFELGRLLGPTVVYTVLSLFGFEAVVAGRLILWSRAALGRLRGLRAFTRLERLLPDPPGRRPDAPETAAGAAARRLPDALSRCRVGSLYCPIDFLRSRPEFEDHFRGRRAFFDYVGELPDRDLDLGPSPRSLARARILTGDDMYRQFLETVGRDRWSEPFSDAMNQILRRSAQEGIDYRRLVIGGEEHRWPLQGGRPWTVHHEPPLEFVGIENPDLWRPIPLNVHDDVHSWWTGFRRLVLEKVPRELRREVVRGDIDVDIREFE